MTDEQSSFIASAPGWVRVLEELDGAILIEALPRKPSGRPGRAYVLKVVLSPALKVWEGYWADYVPKLPSFCPERHVNGDGSFCLGLDVLTVQSARDFWSALRSYLVCQEHAARHGRWPPGRWLSHGPSAAQYQLEAEAAAAAAGLSDRYRRALEFQEGLLAGPLHAPVAANRNRKSRFDRRDAIKTLVAAELARRLEEQRFTETVFAWGHRCCETMLVCPLRDEAERQTKSSGRACLADNGDQDELD